MKRYTLLVIFCGLLITTSASGQDIGREAGFIDLASIERSFDTPPKIEVNVRGSLLRLVTEASRREDPALAEVLSRLKAVQVRTWEIDASRRTDVERHANNFSQRLTRGGWDTVVRVREDGQNIGVFLRESGNLISGLTIVLVESGEATFVNIVGDIDPSEVGMIGRRFNIDGISNIPADRPRR